jgi:N-methylhydantoinase B
MARHDGDPAFFDRALGSAVNAYDRKRPRDWAQPLSGAVLGADGMVFATHGSATPASSAAAVAAVTEKFAGRLALGDVILTNDIWSGSHHPTEFVMLSPVIDTGGQIAGWAELRGTAPDVGGWEFGSYTPKALDAWAEGVRLIPFLVYIGGTERREALGILELNSRTPALGQAFVKALAESAAEAARILSEGEWAQAKSQAEGRLSAEQTELHGRLAGLDHAKGTATVETAIPGPGDGRISVAVELSATDQGLALAFPNSPDRQPQSVNVSETMTCDAALLAIAAALTVAEDDLEALKALVELDVPAGSLLAAPDGSPVGYGRFTTCRAVFEAVLKAAVDLGLPDVKADIPLRFQPPEQLDAATGTVRRNWTAAFQDIERRLGSGS